MRARRAAVLASADARSEALSFLDTPGITRQGGGIATNVVAEHPARIAWRKELEHQTKAHREGRARELERKARQLEHYGAAVPERRRRAPDGSIVATPAHRRSGHADGVTERTARTSGAWHRARARGQRERFARVDGCARTEELSIECACCGTVDEKAARCGAHLVCLRCRGRRAARIRARFLAARDEKLAEAYAAGLFRPVRRGGRWGERLVTLTIPHHDGDTIRGRIDRVLSAWKYFLKRLNAWGRAQKGGTIEFVRVLEWTAGSDSLGHPHLHVWVFSPFLPQELASCWWRDALEKAGLALGEQEELLDVDIRGVSDIDVANKLIKYICKDIGSDGSYVVPEVYAKVYATLDARRAVQSSRGFLGRGDVPATCTHCGALSSRRVRLRPVVSAPQVSADCARVDAATGPPESWSAELEARMAARIRDGASDGDSRPWECAVCTATGREARLRRRLLDGRTIRILCARCASHVGPRHMTLAELARVVVGGLRRGAGGAP